MTNDARRRGRALGLPFPGETGPLNAITDVPGVAIGMTTLIEDPQAAGDRTICTGVTTILPRPRDRLMEPVWAGVHSFNGNGELTGTHWIEDGGAFTGPVCLTNTHSLGIAHHAAIRWMVDRYPETFGADHLWCLPVVGETYDGVLNDINAQALREEHVIAALDAAAPGPVAEGNVGGGAGMIAYEFKAGTGTASRRIRIGDEDYTVAALVQANHGLRDGLTVLGVPVGRVLRDDLLHERETGSIIAVVATDAPLLPHQLRRVAKRGAIGIARGGTFGGNSSGDIFLAFSTANPVPRPAPPLMSLTALDDGAIDPVFEAAVQAIEEAVINAMLAATDRRSVKPAGRTVRAVDHAALLQAMQAHDGLRSPR